MNELGEENSYNSEFFEWQKEGAIRSAREIVPQVLDLVKPQSVVDIGSGVGAWLSVFKENGIEDIVGIDGIYVNQDQLLIPRDNFKTHDLENPLDLERKFDLSVSLEVAEHIPEEHAGTFIDSLTRHAPVILFSAAIPAQGGVHHVNEKWPSYWANHFRERGYVPIDIIRRQVWNNANVDWWYAQNTLLFARQDEISSHPLLKEAFDQTVLQQLDIVHPRNYEEAYSACPQDLYWQKRYSA